jgi:hypothetical protein
VTPANFNDITARAARQPTTAEVQGLTRQQSPAQAEGSDSARPRPPIFVIELQARPGPEGVHDLRALLKLALRRFQMRCLSAGELPPEDGGAP